MRLWRLPVRAHLGALAAVLLVLMAVVGTGASFSADEGAAIIQARSLSRGDGWIVEHPLPGIDPSGADYPLELSARGPKGVAPFAKHPLYAVLLAGADRVGGTTAMVLLSLLGTLAAAAVAAALAGRIDPGLSRAAVWSAGLASPLLFDGFVVIAHPLAAALAGGAVLAAVVAVEKRRPVIAACLAPLMFAAVLLRTEAVLFAVALAVAALIVSFVGSGARRDHGLIAVASVAGAGAGVMAERLWARAIVGATPASTGGGPVNHAGFLAGRVKSFALTWLRPGYDGGTVETLLVLMMLCLVAATWIARRRPGDSGPLRMVGALGASAGFAALIVAPTNLVPGLLVAFPMAAVGLLAIDRPTLDSPVARLALATFVFFAMAVAATQYVTGGSGEWGGRYFALGLPVLVPVLLVALRNLGRRLPDFATRQWCAGALVACSLVMATMGVASIRGTHRFTGDLMSGIEQAGARSAPPGGSPVILTTEASIPRLAWATFDRQRWLLVPPADMESVIGRLRASGVDRLVVVTAGPSRAEVVPPSVADPVSVDPHLDKVGWRVAVVRPR